MKTDVESVRLLKRDLWFVAGEKLITTSVVGLSDGLTLYPGALVKVPGGTKWYVNNGSWSPHKMVLPVAATDVDVTSDYHMAWQKYFIGPFDTPTLHRGLWLPRGLMGAGAWQMNMQLVGSSVSMAMHKDYTMAHMLNLFPALFGEACLHVVDRNLYELAQVIDLGVEDSYES